MRRPKGLRWASSTRSSWCRELGEGRAFTTTLGLTRATWKSSIFRRHLAGAIAFAAGTRSGNCGATIWSNWKRTVVDEDITDGTQIDVGPDGRVYYLERTASHLKIYDPVQDIVKDAGAIPSVPGLGQGLLGLAMDPNFVQNRWMYVYRHVEGLRAHLSRFTLDANDRVDLASEKVVLDRRQHGRRPQWRRTRDAVEWRPVPCDRRQRHAALRWPVRVAEPDSGRRSGHPDRRGDHVAEHA